MIQIYLTAFLKLSFLRLVYSTKKRLHSGFSHHVCSTHLAATDALSTRLGTKMKTIKY